MDMTTIVGRAAPPTKNFIRVSHRCLGSSGLSCPPESPGQLHHQSGLSCPPESPGQLHHQSPALITKEMIIITVTYCRFKIINNKHNSQNKDSHSYALSWVKTLGQSRFLPVVMVKNQVLPCARW